MGKYTFNDALTGTEVTCELPGLDAVVIPGARKTSDYASIFFPGCSLINFGLPLVESTYRTLVDAKCVDGISLLCCGKILSFEPDGAAVRAAFEEQLREGMLAAGVKRIVAACPNCVTALRGALAVDARTTGIEVVALPFELAAQGYRVDVDRAVDLVSQASLSAGTPVRVCIHDSCPDRDTGEFARGVRALMPEQLVVEASRERTQSFCCGSLLRAAGKHLAAESMAQRRGEEARAAGASAVVTSCMSCAHQLSATQKTVPVFHYLELLYDWRICWEEADSSMKLRFLFDDAQGATVADGAGRAFAALVVPASIPGDENLAEELLVKDATFTSQAAALEPKEEVR